MPLEFQITQTQIEDLDRACELFAEAIAYQRANNFPQYVTTDRPGVKQAIEDGVHYKVIKNAQIAAVFNVALNDRIIWRERETGNAVYLHRIITNSQFKGNLLFKKIRDWVEETIC